MSRWQSGAVNVLFITLDQFRGDCLSVAGHQVVETPELDALARSGVRFAHHFSQAAPCGPGRASLYTGMYQMNHRVVANGSPLEDRFDNVARLAARAGSESVLFGYTDQTLDPTLADGPDDPRLATYEGVLSGFDPVLPLDGHFDAWVADLADRGFGELTGVEALMSEDRRPAEYSASAFLTGRIISWLDDRPADAAPFFLHASYLRPHPPYVAAGHWAEKYRPEEMPAPVPVGEPAHPLHQLALGVPVAAAPTDPEAMARLMAQYYGNISLVDHEVGRLRRALEDRGLLEQTVIVVTADHGEQLGDHGLVQKLGYFEESYFIPCLISHPILVEGHGSVVDHFTESVDIMPTLAGILGEDQPVQCDGHSLLPFLEGDAPGDWRDSVHYEWDWRDLLMGPGHVGGDPERGLDECNLAVERTATEAYVHFGDGSWLCFDLRADPTWHTLTTDPSVVLPRAQSMLKWRANHLGGRWTQMVVGPERKGLWPEL